MTTSAFAILVVDGNAATRTRVLDRLRWAGYSPMGASTVEAAVGLLAIFPFDLLIAHAATRERAASALEQVRARRPDVPLMAVPDPINLGDMLDQVARSLAVSRTTRRWPRKAVPSGFNARIGDRAASVVDVSYGGLRVELPDAPANLGATVTVELSPFSLVVEARAVWSAGPQSDGPWRCGAQLAETNTERIRVWRALVDLLPFDRSDAAPASRPRD